MVTRHRAGRRSLRRRVPLPETLKRGGTGAPAGPRSARVGRSGLTYRAGKLVALIEPDSRPKFAANRPHGSARVPQDLAWKSVLKRLIQVGSVDFVRIRNWLSRSPFGFGVAKENSMSGMRFGVWGGVGLSVTSWLVACGGGGAPASQNAMPNMSIGGASGASPAIGSGAGGVSSVAGASASAGTGTGGKNPVADTPCKDTLSDPAHCGSCATSCAVGQVCDLGVCKAPVTSCTAPQVVCNGVCADLTSTAHCGSCSNACASGQSCSGGACGCPGAQTACNGACVDTMTSLDHCGGCNKPCGSGALCATGVCACPTGQLLCGTVCVDVKQSEANCGGCGQCVSQRADVFRRRVRERCGLGRLHRRSRTRHHSEGDRRLPIGEGAP